MARAWRKQEQDQKYPVFHPENQTPYTLQPYETLAVRVHEEHWVWLTRVPGGWLHKCTGEHSSIFVPYSEEFKNHFVAKEYGV